MKYVVTRRPSGASLVNDFDRMFSSFWNDFPTTATYSVKPKVDIIEKDEAYAIEVELPGFDEKDVEVSVEKHVLTLSSKVEKETEEKKDQYLVKERRVASFSRSFVLPEGVDEEHIAGEFKNGILTLQVPKLPEQQPKKIEVKIAS